MKNLLAISSIWSLETRSHFSQYLSELKAFMSTGRICSMAVLLYQASRARLLQGSTIRLAQVLEIIPGVKNWLTGVYE